MKNPSPNLRWTGWRERRGSRASALASRRSPGRSGGGVNAVMKETLFLLPALLLVGCAHDVRQSRLPPYSICFSAAKEPGCWRPQRHDYEQIARDYAGQKKLVFNFEKTETVLCIWREETALVAKVWFLHGIGQQFLAVDIDAASGRVISHRLDYDHS